MKAYSSIDTDFFYEFCLDWQMGYIPRQDLVDTFKGYAWDFSDFKNKAIQNNYWVNSMQALEE